MELRNLRTLVEVARCGGFSAAAKAIGTTQSTVSKAILQLEHDCGVTLVERLGRGIRLTDAGELVLKRASNMLGERDRLVSELAELQGLQRGKLKIGMPVMASGILFSGLVAAFRKRYPGIQVELSEQSIRQIEEDVRKGVVEIGASLLPIAADFEWMGLREDPLMALLPLEHPLAGRSSLKLAELAGSPTILFTEGFALNRLILSAYSRRRLRLTDAGRTGNADFLIAMVSAGLGIAFLPQVLIENREHDSVRVVALEDADMWWRVALIWRKDRSLAPAAKRWLEMAASGNSKME